MTAIDTPSTEREALGLVIADGVAEITLQRPELLNRFDEELHRTLPDLLEQLNGDPSVRAIVLASQGRVFSGRRGFRTDAQVARRPAFTGGIA